MLKKLRLNQTDKFSFSIVTRDIVTMLTSFIDGRPHDISIGSEQGEISNWDDIVIYKANGIYENIQVKQQTTDFSDAACSIDKSQRGKISPLDETMKSLAAWLSVNDPEKSTPPRRFKIILPEGAIKVKKEITVNQFERLCNKETTNHTTLEGFEQLIKNDVATKNICIWLQSWCDFPSNELILRAVKRLEIIVTGNQLSIDEQSEKLISEYFKDVNIVISLIHSFINEQSTYSSAISPRALLNDLKNYLLPGVKKWTQYYLDKDVWKISGIHDTINAIESPSQTVPSLWNPNSEGILKLNARTNSSNLAKAIIRLAF
ncbi:MAG TPA: hypothetical protein VL443_05090, partial [Cyclobacteriaceae bacterium]|nr:hypothetical protein [Cyclobacteriaceae bacterium]